MCDVGVDLGKVALATPVLGTEALCSHIGGPGADAPGRVRRDGQGEQGGGRRDGDTLCP